MTTLRRARARLTTAAWAIYLMSAYNHRNCQSLFGYAAEVHVRSRGRCQLCGCGDPRDPRYFDLWRQMTVEHVIGRSQQGYLDQVRDCVAQRFPELPRAEQESIARRIDAANTVTACSFCNSTTSRVRHPKSMPDLLAEVSGDPDEVLRHIEAELLEIVLQKRRSVRWKLEAIQEAFDRDVLPHLLAPPDTP